MGDTGANRRVALTRSVEPALKRGRVFQKRANENVPGAARRDCCGCFVEISGQVACIDCEQRRRFLDCSFSLDSDVDRQIAGQHNPSFALKPGEDVGVEGNVDKLGQLAGTLRLGAQRERGPVEVDQVVFGVEGQSQVVDAFYGSTIESSSDAMANFGPRGRGEEELRDWLLGGNRKRQILECLVEAPEGGWSAEALARYLEIGPATVYETFRALRGAELLEAPAPRRHQLVAGTDLADALRALVVVLKEEGRGGVARPLRNRR